MITFGPKTLQRHAASWHNPNETEGARLNTRHAALIAADVAATVEARFREAIRMKLGTLPEDSKLLGRLVEQIDPRDSRIRWLELDCEVIAVFTVPESRVEGFRYVVTWHWLNLVDTSGN